MIEINDFSGLTLDDIKNLVDSNSSDRYEVYVPKSTQKFFSDPRDIATDYACAAYAGQLINEISNSFDYDLVIPDLHDSIAFNFETVDKNNLVKTLYKLSCLYGFNENPDSDDIDYDYEEMWQFIDDALGGKVKVACPYFIEIFTEFSNEVEKDEE